MARIIAHLDMDAFFAAVEERDHPQLRGAPIVVGADPRAGRGRGVVSTANYKAREYGIHSAMPISRAWRASETARRQGKPAVVFLRVRMGRYREVSDHIVAILRRFMPLVQRASVDEAYFDLTFTDSFDQAEETCRQIKQTIRDEEHLTASIGVGPNKLIAKIASDAQKPDGLTAVRAEEVEEFLWPLPVRKIPGIGPKTSARLAEMQVTTISDLKRISQDELLAVFGKRGLGLYDSARGREASPVTEAHRRKSIGEQETFQQDTGDQDFVTARLMSMCNDVITSLRQRRFQFRTVVLTVRFADFETKLRMHTLAEPTGSLPILEAAATRLLQPFLDERENPRGKLIRLIGLRVEKLL
jgi:DNA polymerase IV (archaeal DinB-like DNA polymerase)